MTLKQWQSNQELVAWARHLFNQGNWSLLLQLLNEIHPKNSQLPPVASDSVKSTELGKIYGYDVCLNNLNLLAHEQKTLTPVEPDFGAEEMMANIIPLTKPSSQFNK